MQIRIHWIAASLLALLAGCATAPQRPIAFDSNYLSSRTDRLGVAVSVMPKPDTQFPGANCLLCLAFASASNSSLTSAVQSWTTDELTPLKRDLVELLQARGQSVLAIDEPLKMDVFPSRTNDEPDFARRDYSALKKFGIDRLLVVDVRAIGAWRNYSAYIPTGAPHAVFKAEAYIVDLASHKLHWYESVDVGRPAEGNWDEPPKFPGLTNAYFQVLEQGKDNIKRPFVRR